MPQPKASMDVLQAIRERRSIRSYAAQKVDRASVEALLAAAVRAPTAVHEEPWAFAVVQDAAVLKRISDRAKPLFAEQAHRAHLDRGGHELHIFESPSFNIFYDASTLIVICAAPAGPFVQADCWLAAENLILAAWGMGLGTCVVGSALPALNRAEVKAEIGIPAQYEAVAPIIVGIPRGATPISPRKAPRVLAWT